MDKNKNKKPSLFQPFFRTLIGHRVIAELKNEVVIKGILQSCDNYLNLSLIDVEVLNRKAFPQLGPIADTFIRGSSIRYIHLPPEDVDLKRLRDLTQSYNAISKEEQ
ncbi:U6 snRNA-associated Sm-like protein LSm2 [Tritrichomonas musculus]|uniref:U6 snRNA-associated Sm-like protein LSm2 n=1 Tax=Tritrichomonas musculus TaxID=1915356 RepID=A0ABR2KQ90_9EUKA